jgi:hypothetical protein
MLSGKRFHLLAETLGIEAINGNNRVAVVVPAGEVITVISGPRPDDTRLIDVVWGDKKLIMFHEDIQKRGDLVKGGAA